MRELESVLLAAQADRTSDACLKGGKGGNAQEQGGEASNPDEIEKEEVSPTAAARLHDFTL